MESKTILLWSREDLLSSSVELFLAAHAEWKVISISVEKFASFTRTVNKTNPDIVIVSYTGCKKNMDHLMELFQNHPELKIITVNSHNNLIEVYSKQNIMVQTASDFIAIVEANLPSQKNALEIIQTKTKGGDSPTKTTLPLPY